MVKRGLFADTIDYQNITRVWDTKSQYVGNQQYTQTMSKDRRRITEGSPKGRQGKTDWADMKKGVGKNADEMHDGVMVRMWRGWRVTV